MHELKNWFCSVQQKGSQWMRALWGAVCTTLEKFKNAALLLLLSKLSTLIRHENGAFWNLSSNRRNDLKTSSLRFRVDRKMFENGTFRRRWHHNNHVISLTAFPSNTNPKWPVIVAFLNFSGVRAGFIWVSKSNWFCVCYATRLALKIRANFSSNQK